MSIKLTSCAIDDLQQNFKPDLSLLNEIIYSAAIVINPVNIAQKSKWKLKIQKEIEQYRGEISIVDEMR